MKTLILKSLSQLRLRVLVSILTLSAIFSCSKDPIALDKEAQQSTGITTKYSGPPGYTGAPSDCTSSTYAYPECFGAIGDGVNDDTQAIRDAIQTGKTVVLSGKKIYLVSTFDFGDDSTEPIGESIGALFAFDLPSNTTILGQGDFSVLKIADNSVNDPNKHSGCLFQANGKTNITLRGFKIDMNGANNFVPNRGEPVNSINQGLVYAFFGYQATNVTIDQLKIVDNPGKNGIVFWKGANNTITNNWFINGGTSILNNGVKNRYQDDYSAIYVNSSNSNIKWNKIKHDNFPYHYSGGIEIHAPYIYCEENYIERSHPAAYVFADSVHHNTKGCTVKSNSIFDCYSGVIIGGKGKIEHLSVQSNNIYLTTSRFNFTSPELCIAVKHRDDGTPLIESNISNNTIIDNDPITLPTTYKTHFLKVSNCDNLTVHDNTVTKTSGATIMAGSSGQGKIERLYIYNNQFNNFGQNSGPYHHLGLIFDFGVNGADHVYVNNNQIKQDNLNSSDYAYFFNWPNPSTVTNLGFGNASHNPLTNVANVKTGPRANDVTIN